jgi:uncharacterized protein YwqG
MLPELDILIDKYKLNHRRNEIYQFISSSILITCEPVDEESIALGASKIGGLPDLSPLIAWPEYEGRPLSFIAQIRLEDVSPYDLEHRLPIAGILYFFYDDLEQPWGYDPSHREGWRVFYRPDSTFALTRTALPIHSKTKMFKPCIAAFSWDATLASSTLPASDMPDLWRNWGFSEDEYERYKDMIFEEFAQPGVIHRLLGYPDTIQDANMQANCQLAWHGIQYEAGIEDKQHPQIQQLCKHTSDWQLLLQVDTDDQTGMVWGAGGRIFYWIRKQDLQQHDFSNVWLVLECT